MTTEAAKPTVTKVRLRAVLHDGTALVAPESAGWFASNLNAQVAMEDVLADAQPQARGSQTGDSYWDDDYMSWGRPYNVLPAPDGGPGVLVIPIKGMLLNDFSVQLGPYATGYDYISRAVQRGVSDGNVRAIVLDINSPGGVVTGCHECGLVIEAARGAKPVLAFAADTAASAAYWLASQAGEIHVSETGQVGSIGVITGHMDVSRALDSMGIKYTPIFAGERKADGSPYAPLSDAAKEAIQGRVNALYGSFISAVVRGRPLTGEEVRGTQAGVFASHASVRAKLSDRVSTRAEVMAAAFAAKAPAATNPKPANQKQEKAMTDQELEAVRAEARAEGAAAASTRISAILGSEEAAGREDLAKELAFGGTLDAEASVRILKAAPKAAAPQEPQGNAFADAMSKTENPEVGAGAPADPNDPNGLAAATLAAMGVK